MEIFACVGSVLGFLSMRNDPSLCVKERRTQMIISVLTGMFGATIVYILFSRKGGQDHEVSLALAGIMAFGGTDAMIKLLQIFIDAIAKLIQKIVS